MTDRLMERIDCTCDYPPERYFAHGEVQVVTTAAGTYREAAPVPLSRFGYRFAIHHVGKPHAVVISYPDDRRRFMCIVDGTSYDLSTGVLTGFAHPLSGRMLTLRQVLWPRWKDCSITFMTWGHCEPAAAASVEVYELTDLPPLALPFDPNDGSRRELGIQYEDPCGTGASEGALAREEWMDRVIAYARHTGQGLLSYPIVWYHGPRYPSEREPSDDFDAVVAPDRRQYARWTAQPHDWVADLLEKLGANGMSFVGVLTLLRLGSLMARMNTDLEAIAGGAETINNMLSCDQVQAGTMDWTPVYNVRNFPAIVERGLGVFVSPDFPFVYGEKVAQGYPPGPIFNPLHPVVQDAIAGLVQEIGERYGRFPAFKGIAITLWAPTIIWFGSLRSGYDDYTVSLFERETGIRVPVDGRDPKRFSRRHDFLTFTARSVWIEWRCRKIRELVRRMRDALRAARSDLRLTLNLWSEPFVPAILGAGGPQHQLHARPSTVALCREAGIEPRLYEDEPGIELDLQLDGGGRDRTPGMDAEAPLEAFTMFRDHDFLDRTSHAAVSRQARPGIYIFNAWHEAWGKHTWFPCEPEDDQAARLAVMSGKRADGIFRINSEYPKDGFWWDSQLRITPAFPASPHFMEPYAHAVAEFDACRITRGGLFLDKAHGDELRRFAAAYRALPAVKFTQVGVSDDPIAVRQTFWEGKQFWYAVNRDYYPVDVEVVFARSRVRVTDLATGTEVEAPKRWTIVLEPYELRSFSCEPNVHVLDFHAQPPADIIAALVTDAERALVEIGRTRDRGAWVAGLDEVETDLRESLAGRRLARVRRLLTGYAVRKVREMPGQRISR